MKKTTILYISLALCLLATTAGCRRSEVSDFVVDTATFSDFLAEAHIVDSYSTAIAANNRDSLQPLVDAAYDSLYNKYGISKQQYDSTMNYYLRHPQLLDSIYNSVVRKLKAYYQQQESQRHLSDSIYRANNPDTAAPDPTSNLPLKARIVNKPAESAKAPVRTQQ
ncbi:MAG: DUF4296 domain-containing protein [Bacteroidales bacterium]|nr:DUF4296 domain-containing protein [Bacteroidales bacterium]